MLLGLCLGSLEVVPGASTDTPRAAAGSRQRARCFTKEFYSTPPLTELSPQQLCLPAIAPLSADCGQDGLSPRQLTLAWIIKRDGSGGQKGWRERKESKYPVLPHLGPLWYMLPLSPSACPRLLKVPPTSQQRLGSHFPCV